MRDKWNGINQIHRLCQRSKKSPFESRVKHLLSFPEVELHEELKSLFEKMDDKNLVEITHGKMTMEET